MCHAKMSDTPTIRVKMVQAAGVRSQQRELLGATEPSMAKILGWPSMAKLAMYAFRAPIRLHPTSMDEPSLIGTQTGVICDERNVGQRRWD